jgi:hypothetical protein
MTAAELRAAEMDQLSGAAPLLRALWHEARGRWDEAHRIAQDVDTADGAWVHAYLHRREGDLGNARYWYRRADRPEATDALDAEWTRIAETLLQR